jgi:hypothetical protein
MLSPFAFNQIRQVAMNYQLNNYGPQSSPQGPGTPQQALSQGPTPFMNPYAAMDPFLALRTGAGGPRTQTSAKLYWTYW